MNQVPITWEITLPPYRICVHGGLTLRGHQLVYTVTGYKNGTFVSNAYAPQLTVMQFADLANRHPNGSVRRSPMPYDR